MFDRHSIQLKLAGSTFLLLAFTVCSLIVLTNAQMETAFGDYIALHLAVMDHGPAETMFIHSVHQSLWWVGLFFILMGLIITSVLAAGITRPLRRLTKAAAAVERGHFNQRVPVGSRDEVGQLATVFNRMAAKLSQNEQAQRDFFASITHELRTPLAVLQGTLENMTTGVTEPTPERLFAMQEEVMRLNRLVTDLRDLSLAAVHELRLHLRLTDLGQLARQSAMLIQPLLDERAQQLQCQIPAHLTMLPLDADRMRQVIGNLLVNASRHSGDGSHICLTVNEQPDCIELCVANDGPCIPAEELPHIFEKFYQSQSAQGAADSQRSSGLGLALAQQYVAIHHGTISATSTPEDGTAFTVRLPKS